MCALRSCPVHHILYESSKDWEKKKKKRRQPIAVATPSSQKMNHLCIQSYEYRWATILLLRVSGYYSCMFLHGIFILIFTDDGSFWHLLNS